MCTSIEDQLRGQLKEEQEKNENLEVRLELLSDFTEDFIQQINRSILVENQILITELHSIKKLLYDLYEGIDEYYTETLGRNDELVIARADAQLQLIKEIIDEVERIWLKKQYVWISMEY